MKSKRRKGRKMKSKKTKAVKTKRLRLANFKASDAQHKLITAKAKSAASGNKSALILAAVELVPVKKIRAYLASKDRAHAA